MKNLLVVVMLAVSSVCFADEGYRAVQVSDSSVVRIKAKVRYSTLVEFPSDEEIQSVPIGDGAAVPPGQTMDALPNWEIWPFRNTVALKPTLKGARTSMSVVTKDASGEYRTTAFELIEGLGPDIKVAITRSVPVPVLNSDARIIVGLKQEVAARDQRVNELQAMLASAEKQLKAERESSASKIVPEQYFGKIHADYRLGKHAGEPPFLVSQVFNDGRYTYVKCASLEPPGFYERKDGKLSLVDYKYHGGQYVIPKIVDDGALRVGKKQVEFKREEKDAGKPAK